MNICYYCEIKGKHPMKFLLSLLAMPVLMLMFISPLFSVLGQEHPLDNEDSTFLKDPSVQTTNELTKDLDYLAIINRLEQNLNTLNHLDVPEHEAYQPVRTIKESLNPLKELVRKVGFVFSDQEPTDQLIQVKGINKQVPMDRDGHTTEVFRITEVTLPYQDQLKDSPQEILESFLSQRIVVQNMLYQAHLTNQIMELFYTTIRGSIFLEQIEDISNSLSGLAEELEGYLLNETRLVPFQEIRFLQKNSRVIIRRFVKDLNDFNNLFLNFQREFFAFNDQKRAIINQIQKIRLLSLKNPNPVDDNHQEVFFNTVLKSIEEISRIFKESYGRFSSLRNFVLVMEEIYRNNNQLITDYISFLDGISEKEESIHHYLMAKHVYLALQRGVKSCSDVNSPVAPSVIKPINNPAASTSYSEEECVTVEEMDALNSISFDLKQAMLIEEQTQKMSDEFDKINDYAIKISILNKIQIPQILYDTFVTARNETSSDQNYQFQFYNRLDDNDTSDIDPVISLFFQLLKERNNNFTSLIESTYKQFTEAYTDIHDGYNVELNPDSESPEELDTVQEDSTLHYQVLELFSAFEARLIYNTEEKALEEAHKVSEAYKEQSLVFLKSLGENDIEEYYTLAYQLQGRVEEFIDNIIGTYTNYRGNFEAMENKDLKSTYRVNFLTNLETASDIIYETQGKHKSFYNYPFLSLNFFLGLEWSDQEQISEDWAEETEPQVADDHLREHEENRLIRKGPPPPLPHEELQRMSALNTTADTYFVKAPDILKRSIQLLSHINHDLELLGHAKF